VKLKDEVAKDIVLTINKFLEKCKKEGKIKRLTLAEKENLSEKYNYPLDERYSYILNKILDEEKLFISEKGNNFIINGDSEAIKDLEIFKDMNFEEIGVFIGVYIVPLFTLIGLIISKITIYSILVCLTIFVFLNIGNYIAIRNIGSIETLTLNNVSLTMRRLKKNKKVTYEKEIFYDEIFKIYYQEYFIGFYKRDFTFDMKRNMKIKTYFNTYSFGYKMSYEDFKKINSIIEEKIKEHKNYIKKENQDKKALVGYNGVDGKEVTMSKLKEDINEIRDSRSIYGREVEK